MGGLLPQVPDIATHSENSIAIDLPANGNWKTQIESSFTSEKGIPIPGIGAVKS